MGHFHPLADYYLTQVAKGLFLDNGLEKVGIFCLCICTLYVRIWLYKCVCL